MTSQREKDFAAGYDAGQADGAVVGYYDMAWAAYAIREGLFRPVSIEEWELEDLIAEAICNAADQDTGSRDYAKAAVKALRERGLITEIPREMTLREFRNMYLGEAIERGDHQRKNHG